MPNVDQYHGIDLKCLSMPIIADQFRIELSGIDWHWLALIGIGHWLRESLNIPEGFYLEKTGTVTEQRSLLYEAKGNSSILDLEK